MNKLVAFLFVVGGIILLMLGYQEAHSFNSGISHMLSGKPTDKSIWMLIAGAIAVLAGLISLSSGK